MNRLRYLLLACGVLVALPAKAQISAFAHVIVIVQENRTPDNLFWELCSQPNVKCNDNSVNPGVYDIKTDNWLTTNEQTVHPLPYDLAVPWDVEHLHNPDWIRMCDAGSPWIACKMDGAASENCIPDPNSTCPALPEFTYVQRYTGGVDVLGPYLALALNYGWANLMFQTNEGPSFPAHQFIYGATSAPMVDDNENDDAAGIYAAENAVGCLAQPGSTVQLIVQNNETATTYPCFTHETLGTLLSTQLPTLTWRYYAKANDNKNLWTAPNAILFECGVSNQNREDNLYTACTGNEFAGPTPNVIPDPKQILTDIQNCQLANMNWVTPRGQYSDHAGTTKDWGPQWVASIVNSIGESQCADNYWQDTAIIITWDDWGGWYDHEGPQLNNKQYYQLGFRVPMLFVSAYGPNNAGSTCASYIDYQNTLDFGSIANFIEYNFLGSKTNEGALGFADARAKNRAGTQDLTNFYDITKSACTFVPIPTFRTPEDFISDQSQPSDPDDE